MEKQKVFLNTNYMYMEIWYLYVAINNKQKVQIVVHISCLKAGRPVYENNTSKHRRQKSRKVQLHSIALITTFFQNKDFY